MDIAAHAASGDHDARYRLRSEFVSWEEIDGVPSSQGQPWTALGQDLGYSGGRVGIGTQAPMAPLHVLGLGLPTAVFETSAAAAPDASSGLQLIAGNGNVWSFVAEGGAGVRDLSIRAGLSSVDTSIFLRGRERIGIGTRAPRTFLDIRGPTSISLADSPGLAPLNAASVLHLLDGPQTTFGSGNQLLIGSAGSVGTYAQIGFGYTNVSPLNFAPAVIAYQTTRASNYTHGDLIFGTRNADTDTAPLERMRIAGNGNVGIGTAIPNASQRTADPPMETLVVNGNVQLIPNGNAAPPCADPNRGKVWYCDSSQGGCADMGCPNHSGTYNDHLYVCMRTADSTYAWRCIQ